MWLLINNKCDTAADTDVADMCCWHQRFGYTVFERSCLVLVVHHCVLCCVSQAQDPQMLDQLSKNITRCGLSNSTLNYLRVSSGPSDRSVEFVFIPHSLRLCLCSVSCVLSWSPCRSWCPDTRRTVWVPEIVWRRVSSRSGRGWSHLPVRHRSSCVPLVFLICSVADLICVSTLRSWTG